MMDSSVPLCPVDILDPLVRADPYASYARLREQSPVCRLHFGPWLVTRHADVAYLLTAEVCDHWAQAPAAGLNSPVEQALSDALRLMSPEGDNYVRQAVVNALAPTSLRTLETSLAEEASRRLYAAQAHGEIELMSGFAIPLTLEAARLLMGLDATCGARIGTAAAALDGDVFSALHLPGCNPQTGMGAALNHAVTQAIAASEGSDGLIARIVRAAPGLSPARLHNLLLVILFAAHQNLAAFIGNAVVALSEHADDMEVLAGHPKLPSKAVLELLRFDSPIQYIALSARHNFQIGGQHIVAGEPVLACIGSANRDPSAWNEPDRLDFTRDARALLSFGLGPWRCIGVGLAQAVAAVLLSTLLTASGTPRLTVRPDWGGRGPFVHRGPSRLYMRLGTHG